MKHLLPALATRQVLHSGFALATKLSIIMPTRELLIICNAVVCWQVFRDTDAQIKDQ
jgi:hypothetical protein